MNVYITISTWGYDGGDDIEQVSGDLLTAKGALREVAETRGWGVYEDERGLFEDERGLFAQGSGIGHGIRIQKWEVK